jgi:N utilization substance protein B
MPEMPDDTEATAPEAGLEGSEGAEAVYGEGKDDEYSRILLSGVLDKVSEIDGRIEACSEHWRLDRIAVVDRNILRIAVYELLYKPDIPYKVIIDEAIEIAKSYGTTESGAFINGVLDHLHKDMPSDNQANAR